MKTADKPPQIPVIAGRIEYHRQLYSVDPQVCVIRRERWSRSFSGHAKVVLHAVAYGGRSVARLEGEVIRRAEPECPWLITIAGELQVPGYDNEDAAKDAVILILAERIWEELRKRISDSQLAQHNAVVNNARSEIAGIERELDAARERAAVAERLRDEFLEQRDAAKTTAAATQVESRSDGHVLLSE